MKFPRAGIVLLTIFISVTPILLTGCSVVRPVGDFFNQRYVNTVSYFNTFYNAKHLYDEAVNELGEAERRHRQQRREGTVDIPQQTKQKFNDVIEKCSRLLHQYPTSKYADDAVLMIGRSYYKMRQNVQAERKFLELLSEFPDSRHIPDAQLLLAKTQRRLNKHGEAQLALLNLVDRLDSRRDRDIASLARIELGDIEKQAGNLNNAAGEFTHAIDLARDREIRTEARFHLANVYYDLGYYDEAFDKFAEVIDDRPTGGILYESQISRARILTLNEKYDLAIDLLEDLLTDLRLADYISRIKLEAANVYRDQGLFDKAIDQYVYVDTTHARTRVSTEAQYALAAIYKDTFGNFKKAKEYYERVSRATPASDLTLRARTINDHLTRYWKHRNEITRLDSVIAEQNSRFREIEMEFAAAAETVDTDMSPDDTAGRVDDDTLGVEPEVEQAASITPEELQNQIASNTEELVRNYAELAGLFYIEMERPDSALYYYSRLAYNFPESSYAPQAIYALAELVRVAAEAGHSLAGTELLLTSLETASDTRAQRDSLYRLLIDRYPDNEFAIEAKRILGMEIPWTESDPMEEIYLQAEQELVEGNHEDALYFFEYIVRENTDSKYTVKACYAIGWMYENIFMKPDSAVVYYQTIIEKHPETRFASAVNDKVSAWLQQIAEEERQREEEEAARIAEQAEEEEKPEEIDEEPPAQRGIPLVRPTDVLELEEKPDTTRIEEHNED